MAKKTTRAKPAAAAGAGAATRTLSLRLQEADYQRLRRFAFDTERSHQDVLVTALKEYLAAQRRS